MSAHAVQALLVVALGWYLLTEALHAGVAADRTPAPWRALGPLVLVDEVWLVVVLALLGAGFPASDHRAWATAAGTLLVALLLSLAQFALLLLGPALRDNRRVRGPLRVLGHVVPLGWALALGDVAGAPWLASVAFGLVAVGAALLLGAGFADLPTASGPRRWARPAGGAAVLVLLVGAAFALAPDALLRPSGDGATLRLLAWSIVAVGPLVVLLQVVAWRWTLVRWLRGDPLVPIHAADRPVPVP